jgi:hypothetical protein
MRGHHRRLAIESCEQRLLLTAACSADSSTPVPDVPAEIAVEEAQLDASSAVLEGVGPRVRPGAEATRTLTESGFTIKVELSFPDVAVAPDLAVAPADPTGQTAAPT